jgi:hypothetical protein
MDLLGVHSGPRASGTTPAGVDPLTSHPFAADPPPHTTTPSTCGDRVPPSARLARLASSAGGWRRRGPSNGRAGTRRARCRPARPGPLPPRPMPGAAPPTRCRPARHVASRAAPRAEPRDGRGRAGRCGCGVAPFPSVEREPRARWRAGGKPRAAGALGAQAALGEPPGSAGCAGTRAATRRSTTHRQMGTWQTPSPPWGVPASADTRRTRTRSTRPRPTPWRPGRRPGRHPAQGCRQKFQSLLLEINGSASSG